MIVGIGVDVVNVAKFGATVATTQGFLDALLTPREQVDESGEARRVASMAARYAAKEALAKAIGVPPGMDYQDAEVLVEPDGRPYLVLRGSLREAALQLGVRSWHLSLAMEGDVAMAYVIAEGTSSLAGVSSLAMVEQA